MRRPSGLRSRLPSATASASGGKIDRRRFIQLSGMGLSSLGLANVGLSAGLVTAGGLSLSGCRLNVAPDPGPRWMEQARVAGEAVYVGYGDARLGEVLDQFVASGVSVIEGDSNMSDLLSPTALAQTLDEIAFVTRKAHERNLKVIWYYPALEVITPNGEYQDSSMFKDNPSWVQYNIEGKPNVFYGSMEHWVDPGAESAWMCHNSPYRDYFFDRVRRLGLCGVDGVWVDVPLYMDTVVRWVCTNPHCNAKFLAETGMEAPKKEDWTSPAWRRWIYWRHQELDRFCRDIYTAVAADVPDLQIICETVPLDYNQATVQALAGDFLGADAKNVGHVWEVDSVSNDFGMKPASHDDWLCKIRMFKFAKGCDRGRYTWCFTYGHKEVDAGLVIAAAVATGCSPYETKTPKMTTTVGADFRRRMFTWIARHKEKIFDADSLARVVVIQSSSSRDFTDQGKAEAMFSSLGIDADESYWQHNDEQLLDKAPYLSEYTGICKALSHLKVPFLIQPIQGLLEPYLDGIQLVVAPSLSCISDAHASLLLAYVRRGGALLLTGPQSGKKDEFGNVRKTGVFDTFLKGGGPGKIERRALDKGAVYVIEGSLGRRYLVDNDLFVTKNLATICEKTAASAVKIEGDRHVHVEYSVLGSSLLVHLVNYKGAGTPTKVEVDYPFEHALALVPDDVKASIEIPQGKQVLGVEAFSPDKEFKEGALVFKEESGHVSFSLQVFQYVLVVITLA